jgi:hypothetical protein
LLVALAIAKYESKIKYHEPLPEAMTEDAKLATAARKTMFFIMML